MHGTREVIRCSGSCGERRGRAVRVQEAAGFGGAAAPGALWTVMCLRKLWQVNTENKVDSDGSY